MTWWGILLVVIGFVPALALGIFLTAFAYHWADAMLTRALAKRGMGR